MENNKVLFVLSQPTQSVEPLELISNTSGIDLTVTFLSGTDAKLWQGEEFINKKCLSLSLPTSVKSLVLKNFSWKPSLSSRFGLVHPALIKAAAEYNCVVVYGHAYVSMWFAIVSAKLRGRKVILTNDAVDFAGRSLFKRIFKRVFYRFLYCWLADHVLVPSSRALNFLKSLGISQSKISLTPYVVDNQKIASSAEKLKREEERISLGLPNEKIILFVGKLIQRKRPHDLILALRKMTSSDAVLVIVGDGPLRPELESDAERLGLSTRIVFLGELEYTRLISAYVATDVLVHPAEHEPWGLIVNEAMLCGTPVVTSDAVGASDDLIQNGKTGYTYPSGDTTKLAEILDRLLNDAALRSSIAKSAKMRMLSWSPKENAAATIEAISQ